MILGSIIQVAVYTLDGHPKGTIITNQHRKIIFRIPKVKICK